VVRAVAGGKDRHSKVATASTTASLTNLASPQRRPSSLPLHGADQHGADPRRRPSPSLLAAAAAGASTTTTVTGARSTMAGARSMAAAPAPAGIHGGAARGGRYNTSLPLPLPSSPWPRWWADPVRRSSLAAVVGGSSRCVGGLGWERTGSLAGLRMGSSAGSWFFFFFFND